jgi:hypothetical protein
MASALTFASLVNTEPGLDDVATNAAGPAGRLPLTEELLRHAPSGDLFGWTQDVGMGWNPTELNRREFLTARRAASVLPMARQSPWAITPGTGRSACS